MLKTLQAWLGLGDTPAAAEPALHRELLDALDRLDPARAQFLARFAFLLGRVARVDERVSEEAARAMEIVLIATFTRLDSMCCLRRGRKERVHRVAPDSRRRSVPR